MDPVIEPLNTSTARKSFVLSLVKVAHRKALIDPKFHCIFLFFRSKFANRIPRRQFRGVLSKLSALDQPKSYEHISFS